MEVFLFQSAFLYDFFKVQAYFIGGKVENLIKFFK